MLPNQMTDIEHSKICPRCGKRIFYKNGNSYRANKNKNTPCRECRYKSHSNLLRGRKRPPFSDKWKKNIALAHKASDVWKASMNTPEYKEKQRQKMIRLIKENKTKVGYNKKACSVFDFINQSLGWGGVHAGNRKEQAVDGFFMDFYEPTLNVVVEWDEKHHRKPSRHKADWIKQHTVLKTLGCEFYRIDDVTKLVRKVDSLPLDRSNKIQSALDEYYQTYN